MQVSPIDRFDEEIPTVLQNLVSEAISEVTTDRPHTRDTFICGKAHTQAKSLIAVIVEDPRQDHIHRTERELTGGDRS